MSSSEVLLGRSELRFELEMSRSFVGCVLFLAAVVLAQTTEGAENSCILTPDVGSREPARPAESDKPLARFYSDATPTLCAGHKGTCGTKFKSLLTRHCAMAHGGASGHDYFCFGMKLRRQKMYRNTE